MYMLHTATWNHGRAKVEVELEVEVEVEVEEEEEEEAACVFGPSFRKNV